MGSLAVLTVLGAHPVYPLLFLGELLLLISPLIDSILGKAGIHLKLLRFVSYFSLMNLAFPGFWRFINGIQSNIWTPTKRNL
ncbi:MAG: hypothetical protein IPL69_20850 [Saprospiraceae bacterium]|nr:hypothetical protein [Candidatus Brachybacter algidus]